MSTLEKTKGSSRKIGQYLFIGILVLHVIGCFVMGLSSLFNPQFAFETGFQMAYDPGFRILSVVIGMELLFLGSIAILGIIWTRRKSLYGIYAGSAVGVYMLVFGFVAFAIMGETNGLIVDSSRGLLTLIFAFFAYQELKK